MSARICRIAMAVVMLAVMIVTCAGAEGAISANVVMKVSRTAQDSIINEGEDLSIDVNIDGVEPASYRWYFGEEPISGANYSMHSISAATMDDAGMYRVEAFDEEGGMLVSMDFNVRVMEKAMPKSGDNTVSAGVVAGAMAALAAIACALFARRRHAAA